MPKATIDKDRDFLSGENYIWSSYDGFAVKYSVKTHTSQN
jgi:hypothetical protein